jgi:hypothetical protein
MSGTPGTTSQIPSAPLGPCLWPDHPNDGLSAALHTGSFSLLRGGSPARRIGPRAYTGHPRQERACSSTHPTDSFVRNTGARRSTNTGIGVSHGIEGHCESKERAGHLALDDLRSHKLMETRRIGADGVRSLPGGWVTSSIVQRLSGRD